MLGSQSWLGLFLAHLQGKSKILKFYLTIIIYIKTHKRLIYIQSNLYFQIHNSPAIAYLEYSKYRYFSLIISANFLANILTCVLPIFSAATSTKGSYSLYIILNISNPSSFILKLLISSFQCSSLHPYLNFKNFNSLKTTGIFTKILLISISSKAVERSATESKEMQDEMSQYEKTGERTVSARRKSLASVQEGLKIQRQQNQKKDLKNLHIFWPMRVKLEWKGKQSRPQEGCFFMKVERCFSLRFQLRYQFSVLEFLVKHLRISTNTQFFLSSLEITQIVSMVKFYPISFIFSYRYISSYDFSQSLQYFTTSPISQGRIIHYSISCWHPLRKPNTFSYEFSSISSFFFVYFSSYL